MGSVSVRDVAVGFGDVNIFQNLSMEIERGEFIVLLGPSGCGKSTLLNAIAGLLDVKDGQVWIDDRNVTWNEPKDRGIGMVFQSYSLYPRMSVERNLSFGLRIAKFPKDEIAKRDAKLRNELRVEIKKLHQEIGNTMIYVTHDQVEALTLADRIAVMKGGVIQQFASPHDIYYHPANLFVAGFIGSPAMNAIDGSLGQRGGAWRFEAKDLSVDVSRYPFASAPKAGPATLGVRPEHIGLGEAPRERNAATGKLTIVEPMGGEAVLWTSLAGKPATIKVAGDSDVRVGDDLRFHFDMARASLFEGQTGQRL